MITLQNMIFANPQAYRVFPQIANPYNTGITDTAIFTGYIQVTDSNGTTKSFSNTNTIDFSGFSGVIDIDQYTDTGSVKLGRWNIGETDTPDEPDKPVDAWRMRVIASDTFNSMPADGVVITGTQDSTYWVGLQAYNEAQQRVVDIPSVYIEDVTKYGGNISMTVTSFTPTTIDGRDVMRLSLTLDKNPDMKIRTASINVQFRLTKEDCEQLLGSTTMMGWFGSVDYAITQLAQPYISPYTPAFSIPFSMTSSGQAGKQITNGIEIYQTGTATGDESYHFFAYTEDIAVGEKYYSATIQVTGLPEGYTIQGVRGWDSVTITQDGEYTIPEFTCPELDLYEQMPYDNKPAFMFTSDVPANTTLDTPIKIIITAVQSMEESINEHTEIPNDEENIQ